MEVLAAVAPAVDVDATDVLERADGAGNALDHRSQLGSQLGRQVLQVVMRPRDQDGDDRQAGWFGRNAERPVLVLPDVEGGIAPAAEQSTPSTPPRGGSGMRGSSNATVSRSESNGQSSFPVSGAVETRCPIGRRRR